MKIKNGGAEISNNTTQKQNTPEQCKQGYDIT